MIRKKGQTDERETIRTRRGKCVWNAMENEGSNLNNSNFVIKQGGIFSHSSFHFCLISSVCLKFSFIILHFSSR